MTQYTEIADVPTDLEVVDSMGFTWSNRHGFWGFQAPGSTPDEKWFPSAVAAACQSTAYMGPFAEVR